MSKHEFYVQEQYKGERIDKVIAEEIKDLTRSYIQKLLENNNITVNGSEVRSNYKVRNNDFIVIDLPVPEKLSIEPEDIKLDIVYEDSSLLVINKPAGMVVHPAVGNYSKTLVNALLSHCGDTLSTINGVHRPGIVHRLDKDTTGLIMVAKGDKAHLSLSNQLKTRDLKRRYVALLHGNIKEDEFTVNKNIVRNPKDRKQMSVSDKSGRVAITNVKVIERFGMYSLVNCYLDTGRTHQIRVHMRYIGHPVLGDKTYGIKNEEFNLEGQLLHADKIGFIHPETEEYMEFNAKAPENFEKILNIIRKKYGQVK